MPPHRPQLKRINEHGHGRYLTCSCYRRLPLFKNDRIKDALAEHLALIRQMMPFHLYAWVIMPEHIHLLVLPVGPTTVTALLRRLKSPFARRMIERWRQFNAPVFGRVTDNRGKARFWQRSEVEGTAVIFSRIGNWLKKSITSTPTRCGEGW